MLTVNELAMRANAPAQVVGYNTRIGLIQPSAQRENGDRLFASRAAKPFPNPDLRRADPGSIEIGFADPWRVYEDAREKARVSMVRSAMPIAA